MSKSNICFYKKCQKSTLAQILKTNIHVFHAVQMLNGTKMFKELYLYNVTALLAFTVWWCRPQHIKTQALTTEQCFHL